ncbi:Protein of unknown function [Pyronema omphalodes CBS 100304]|uniref:Uncharacterized protein n=1 Tax=Pyronema omphalodes (strain CBS 100304) TaxID=1076935 RepID=U4L4H3_PYROM|nr:Protein of unknown function [Pyronema omphalodes CBS 100304]
MVYSKVETSEPSLESARVQMFHVPSGHFPQR